MENTQTTDTGSEVTEPGLDEVIAQFKPVAAAPAPVVQQAPVQPATQVSAPKIDPLDETSFGNYVNQVNNGQSVLSNQLQDVQAELTQLRENSSRLQIETDINDAVSRINDGLNLDPKLVRIHLEYTANEKPGFKAIWDNRAQNPEGFTAALKALSREIGGTYAVQTDPELVANQKAIQQSQQSRSTDNSKETSGNSLEDKLAEAKNPGDFDRIWRSMVGV